MAITTRDRVKILLGLPDSNTSKNDLIDQLLPGVEEAIQGYCRRTFAEATRTQFLTGTGHARLILPHYPVSSVQEVRVDLTGHFGQSEGSFGDATELTEGVDYALELTTSNTSGNGFLRRLGGPGSAWSTGWGPGVGVGGNPYGGFSSGGGSLTLGRDGPCWLAIPGSIKVTYTAGYSAINMPADLQMAADQLVASVMRTGKFGGELGVSSESLGQYSMTLAAGLISSMPAIGSPRQILNRYRAVDI